MVTGKAASRRSGSPLVVLVLLAVHNAWKQRYHRRPPCFEARSHITWHAENRTSSSSSSRPEQERGLPKFESRSGGDLRVGRSAERGNWIPAQWKRFTASSTTAALRYRLARSLGHRHNRIIAWSCNWEIINASNQRSNILTAAFHWVDSWSR